MTAQMSPRVQPSDYTMFQHPDASRIKLVLMGALLKTPKRLNNVIF